MRLLSDRGLWGHLGGAAAALAEPRPCHTGATCCGEHRQEPGALPSSTNAQQSQFSHAGMDFSSFPLQQAEHATRPSHWRGKAPAPSS